MARILVTGSADGLGRLTAAQLADEGHEVVLHARNAVRAEDARRAVPDAIAVAVGDLGVIEEVRRVADQAHAAGPLDAVIHNAGVGFRFPQRIVTTDGLELHFAVNVLAPYLLTALVPAASLVYLSSGMHRGAVPDFDDLQWERRRWNGSRAYAESKFLDVALAVAVARRWPAVRSNAVEPGWVATRMGGPGAPDDLRLGADTQAWLAVGEDPRTQVSGAYFYHRQRREPDPATTDPDLQDTLLGICEKLTGVSLPPAP